MREIKFTHVRRKTQFDMESTHTHEDYEIYYLMSGKRRFFIHDTVYFLEKGGFALLKSNIVHQTLKLGKDAHERAAIYFPHDYMKTLFPDEYEEIVKLFDDPCIAIQPGAIEYIETLMSHIEAEYEMGDKYSKMLIRCYLRELLVFLSRSRASGKGLSIPGGNTVIEQATRYIVQNYNKNITLEDVSEYVHLSSGYFSKKFKAETGIGFKEYLLKIRIQKASQMLYESKKSITEIAFECGFNDSNYFGDAFTRVMGMSPSKYRKLKKGLMQ